MSRILFVSTSTTLGGAEKTLYSLATLLDPRRFTVAGVVSLKPFGTYAHRLKTMGVPVHTLGVKSRPTFKDVKGLIKILEHEQPDIVHALMYQAIQFCRVAKRRAKAHFKLISSPRVSYRTRSTLTLLVDRVLKGSDDLLICECEASRKYLIKHQGYNPAKVTTIYNGVDNASWPVSKLERAQKRLELRLGAGELLLGAVGRLDAQKNHALLIDAMARLKDRHPVRCVILGEGPKRASLEAQIRRNHLEKHVWLLGERDDVTTWLSCIDVFVLPSLWEGLPNALLEAMAMGLPVVASNVDGVAEVVADNQNGLLVPPRSAPALAKRIAELCSNALLRQRLGQAARETIAERFTLLNMLAAYEKTYSEIR
ncbi:MAG: glycosyltransferase [Elusimicrobia bacterium]|nr:glycosyltransferase [Elusimicrobiota bacterium]